MPQTNEFVPFQKHIYLYRTFLLFGFGLVATFGSSKLEFPGAGPLGCLTMAFVAALRWRKEIRSGQEVSSFTLIEYSSN